MRSRYSNTAVDYSNNIAFKVLRIASVAIVNKDFIVTLILFSRE